MLLLVCSTFLFIILDLVPAGQGQQHCSWTIFSDVHSRVVVAKVVFRGRMLPTSSEAMDKDIWKVTVDEVFKGEMRDSETTIQMVVGSELDACPKVDMEVGQSYLLYLKSTERDGSNDLTSIYYASSPPEVMTVKKVREAKKYGCRQCGNSGQYPKARLLVKGIFWSVGERIEMTCQLDGSPAPRVTWYKNNLTIKTSSNVQIISHKSSSQLIIGRADDFDGGIYSCDAVNVLGSASSQQSHVVIEAGALALNDGAPTAPPHATICEQQTLCLNGGVCYEIKELGTKFCICREGFTGPRCQDKGHDIGIGGFDDILVIVCILLMILLLVTTFAMLFCIAKFRHDVGQHINRYFEIAERNVLHNSNGELQLQSIQSDRKHRRSSEMMESQALLFPSEDLPSRQPKTTPRTTEAARVGSVTTAQASSSSSTATAAAAIVPSSSASYPADGAPGPLPSRPRFDSDAAKMAWLGWKPQGSVPASELDLGPDGGNERMVPSPVVQKRLQGVSGDDSWTSHNMSGSLANCSTAAATYIQSQAVDSRVLAGDSAAAKGRAMKELLASRVDRGGKRGPSADYDDDVNALLIELGVYVSEGGSFSTGGDNV